MTRDPELYAYHVGIDAGQAAYRKGDRFAGLSKTDWHNASDDYANGYRRGWHYAEARKNMTISKMARANP
jgi:hypothetical protein